MLFARFSGLMLLWGLMGGRRKMLIAAAATAAFCNYETISRAREIVQKLAGIGIVYYGTYRDRQLDGFADSAAPVAAFAMAAALGFMLGIEPKMKQRVVMLARDHDDIPAAASISAAGAAAWHELLTPEGKAAVTAVAGLDVDFNFVDEHVIRPTAPFSRGSVMI